MESDWSKRKFALELSDTYTVAREARSVPPPDFKIGEKVTLTSVGYIPYDNSHVYVFETRDGRQKSFWLHDDDPLSRLAETFNRIAL